MTEPLPLDVRLMNATAGLLWIIAALSFVATLAWVLVRHPVFAIQSITVTGQTQHNNEPTLRANVLPRLTGNFFTLDLQQAQRAFEQVPWVRTAVVRRDFPNRLHAHLQEHQAVALFGAERDASLVNDRGEVFVANAADTTDDLPRLIGQESQALEMLRMHTSIKPLFVPLDLEIVELALSARGSWRATLDNDAVIELGRGDEAAQVQSIKRFVQAVTRASAQLGKNAQVLEFADLRYPNGFAIRLRGITVQVPTTNPNPKR